MNEHDVLVTKKLAATVAGFLSENWRVTGSINNADETTVALKHTNGNRLSIIATSKEIAIIINGHLRSRKPITCHPVHVKNPK